VPITPERPLPAGGSLLDASASVDRAAVEAEAPAVTQPSGASEDFFWQSSLRQTFRLIPPPDEGDTMRILLESEGLTDEQILPLLPYEAARARTPGSSNVPDPRRLRDPRQVAQTVGLLYRDADGANRVTELGVAVRRWLPTLGEKNWPALGQHAAYALATCQLRNPLSQSGRAYPQDTKVFPFLYIWRAMLALEGKISSDELNRAIFRTRDLNSLNDAIARIARRRKTDGPLQDLGDETVTEERKNDRIIPWMSLASFGWMFVRPKGGSEYYQLRPRAERLLAGASRAVVRHRDFDSAADYVRHVSKAACLPKDLR
jgi:hypothetical protein